MTNEHAEVTQLRRKVGEAAAAIRKHARKKPVVGIILGTGLGKLAGKIRNKTVVPYEAIPHFPATTVDTHAGDLVIGALAGKTVATLSGRFHYYKGYSITKAKAC